MVPCLKRTVELLLQGRSCGEDRLFAWPSSASYNAAQQGGCGRADYARSAVSPKQWGSKDGMRDRALRLLPAWFWRRSFGFLCGLLCALICTLGIAFIDRNVAKIPNPSLPYTLVILGFAYGWGGRVGFATAIVSFVFVWYAFFAKTNTPTLPASGEWTPLFLIAVTFSAMALVGDTFRRLRRANARLSSTVERLDAIIDSMADGVLVLDRQGKLVQANEAMHQLFGGDLPPTIAGRAARWHVQNADESRLVGGGPSYTALQGIVTNEVAMLIDEPDGSEVPISVSSAPIRSLSGAITGAVIVCRDMSAMRRLQEAKDDFLSIASHELKTPLTSLRGYAQLLNQRLLSIGPADERILRYLTTIDNQTRRVAELVDTLLDVSRLDAGRLQLRRDLFDLVALVREAAAQVGELSSRHTIVVQPEVPNLVGDWDRDRVEQIIVNLLTNAVRYSPAGGAITVSVGMLPRNSASATGEQEVMVRVRDSGVGIAHDQLERIFERFHRVHEGALHGFAEAQRGIGIGLFLSRELAQRHGGQLWAESAGIGQGATFILVLPQVGPRSARAQSRGGS